MSERLAERLHRLLCRAGMHIWFVDKQVDGYAFTWNGSWRCGCCGVRKERR